jgi:formate hydrogenlyase subunit 6/NADH:ubiquinone oxidoreductase subunit I
MVDYDHNGQNMKVPAINESRCIGCGACENLCPARPFSAIYVEGNPMHQID